MKTTHQLALLSVLCAIPLSGCASADERFPSLDIRPAERSLGTRTPTAPDAIELAPGANQRSIQSTLDKAVAANADFAIQQRVARELIAAAQGQGEESDSRARALIALAGLTTLRGQTTIALADLDALEFEAATEFSQTDVIRAAQASVVQMIASQDEALDSLSEMLAK